MRSHGWEIELFCQAIPVERQWGVRHFHIERRLLEVAPQLRTRIRQLKQEGLKTEPAFAQVLRLSGAPGERNYSSQDLPGRVPGQERRAPWMAHAEPYRDAFTGVS